VSEEEGNVEEIDLEISDEALLQLSQGRFLALDLSVVGLNGKTIIEANINELKEAWQKPLRF